MSSLTSLQNNNTKSSAMVSRQMKFWIKFINWSETNIVVLWYKQYRTVLSTLWLVPNEKSTPSSVLCFPAMNLYSIWFALTFLVNFDHVRRLMVHFEFALSQWQGWWHISICLEPVTSLMVHSPFGSNQLQVDGEFPVCFEPITSWWSISRLFWVSCKIDGIFPVCFESDTKHFYSLLWGIVMLVEHCSFISSHSTQTADALSTLQLTRHKRQMCYQPCNWLEINEQCSTNITIPQSKL
jgi:hypothetical protein